MIKNEKQYNITKCKLEEFLKSLELLEDTNDDDLLKQVMKDSISSQIVTFKREIKEYEILKNEKPKIISTSIVNLPETLIKVRIAKGLTQNELAKKIGVKEQQIQRYESNNYETANFEKIINIAKSMDIIFEETKVIINSNIISVRGYDEDFMKNATKKLHSRKALLI